MSAAFLSFDQVRHHAKVALDAIRLPEQAPEIYLVRNLFGKVGISVSEHAESNDTVQDALRHVARTLHESLGAYSHPEERAVLWVDDELLNELRDTASKISPGIFWVDRLLVGESWWTVGDKRKEARPVRYTLHSVKGGVGRSTTAAVLAWHLARQGEDVLVIDLDIESPGIASAVLDEKDQPEFGVVDWFVEELVGQGDHVIDHMSATPAWAHNLPGSVWVVPAHGRDPGEYLAKLGRTYMDTAQESWTERLRHLLASLERTLNPTVVVLESRSGLHDIAAATVTDLDAEVLLFAVDSPSTWTGYGILFDHWAAQGLAPRIRERLSIVSALTPEVDTHSYLKRFRENAWNLFRDRLYDTLEGSVDPADAVSYDLSADDAPHNPLVIHWNRGLAVGVSLRRLEETTVSQAYSSFLKRFGQLHHATVSAARQTIEIRKQRVGDRIGAATRPAGTTASDTETLRIALSELPEGTSHGGSPPPAETYLPPSHRKALHPNAMLVTGMRGSGKTFWWGGLQDPLVRTLLARLSTRLPLTAETEVLAGYGVAESPDRYPGPDDLRSMTRRGVDPALIWRTVHARHMAGPAHPLRGLDSWPERTRYVKENTEFIRRLFRDKDHALDQQGIYSLVLFDGLDRSADEWPDMFQLIRGLLRHALDMRSYRRLRAKVFLRSDQADEEKVADFADASKVLASSVQLAWPRRDLYGMLWQYLGNGQHGEHARPRLAKGDWPTEDIGEQQIFTVPASLAGDEDVQRERFHSITGPWMGTDRRRGFPYTWIPNHLADSEGAVSPRSFIAALRTAASDTADRHRSHDYALHYDSVKRGVQMASKTRVRELREDYPWVDRLLSPLTGVVVPCEFGRIESIWDKKGILKRLEGEVGQNEVKLPPRSIQRGGQGIRQDLESLGVFRRLHDGRVDIPDVFRVGYGLGRRGGVRPAR